MAKAKNSSLTFSIYPSDLSTHSQPAPLYLTARRKEAPKVTMTVLSKRSAAKAKRMRKSGATPTKKKQSCMSKPHVLPKEKEPSLTKRHVDRDPDLKNILDGWKETFLEQRIAENSANGMAPLSESLGEHITPKKKAGWKKYRNRISASIGHRCKMAYFNQLQDDYSKRGLTIHRLTKEGTEKSHKISSLQKALDKEVDEKGKMSDDLEQVKRELAQLKKQQSSERAQFRVKLEKSDREKSEKITLGQAGKCVKVSPTGVLEADFDKEPAFDEMDHLPDNKNMLSAHVEMTASSSSDRLFASRSAEVVVSDNDTDSLLDLRNFDHAPDFDFDAYFAPHEV